MKFRWASQGYVLKEAVRRTAGLTVRRTHSVPLAFLGLALSSLPKLLSGLVWSGCSQSQGHMHSYREPPFLLFKAEAGLRWRRWGVTCAVVLWTVSVEGGGTGPHGVVIDHCPAPP